MFGWEPAASPLEATSYTLWKLDGRTIAGMMPMSDQFPPEIPSHWTVCFAVEDADAVAGRAHELGGAIIVPPTDVPPGRFAVLTDPQGAPFSVIELV